MNLVHVKNQNHSSPPSIQANYCDSFFCQLRGYMFRSNIAPNEGLILSQRKDGRLDTAIHMLFVFMDLAVVWINAEFEVVDKVLARAWRPFYLPQKPAKYILEIHPSRLDEFNLGDRVEFRHV